MITKAQALALQHGATIHLTHAVKGRKKCQHWRVSGQMKTWKTRPNDFRIPIKHGLYEHGYLDQDNAAVFHIPGGTETCEDYRPLHAAPVDHFSDSLWTEAEEPLCD